MTEKQSDDSVGLPPNVKQTLSSILAHAASQERTVIELRTAEAANGRRHFTNALEITEHVAEMENQQDKNPKRGREL
ncbi:hypothetical protein [Halomonas sp.]|uniref:hypothetical protein n=1 Tax=Halomonas sp. TaxID=1486246 RepID=UPI0035614611